MYDVKVLECAPKAVDLAERRRPRHPGPRPDRPGISDGVAVGYVNPMVIAPLERRDVVWKKFVASETVGGSRSEKLTRGHKDNAELTTPALKEHPEVKAVFAPYGEPTKGTVDGDQAEPASLQGRRLRDRFPTPTSS